MEKQEKKLDSLKMFRDLVKTGAVTLKNDTFAQGSMISCSYNAKDKTKVWDQSPLMFVLRRSKGYTLALNFHWVPSVIRATLLNYILKVNSSNVKQGKPLSLSYSDIKTLIIKLKLRNVVRLYINSRISRKGIVIPTKFMKKAIDLPSENFIGVSAEKAYAIMNKKAKSKKGK